MSNDIEIDPILTFPGDIEELSDNGVYKQQDLVQITVNREMDNN